MRIVPFLGMKHVSRRRKKTLDHVYSHIWLAVFLFLPACDAPPPKEPRIADPAPVALVPSEPLRLQPGDETRRSFEEGTPVHPYIVSLDADQYVLLVIRQRGVDVAIDVTVEGQAHSRFDSPTGADGEERLELWSAEPQEFLLQVSGEGRGAYDLRIVTWKDATPEERARARWWLAFAQAEELRRRAEKSHRELAVEAYERLLIDTEQLSDPYPAAQTHRALATTLWRLGRRHEAAEVYGRIPSLLKGRPDPDRLQVAAWNSLGYFHRQAGRFAEARAEYDRSIRWSRAHRYAVGEGRALDNLARVASAEGAVHEAIDLYEQARDIFHRAGERGKEAEVLADLGGLYTAWSAFEDALDYLERARELVDPNHDEEDYADLLEQSADLHLATGRLTAAHSGYSQALSSYRKTGDRRLEGYALSGLGRVEARRGQPAAALEHFESALKLFRQIGEDRGEGIVRLDSGWVRIANGELERGEEDLRAALQLLRRVRYRAGEAQALLGLGHVERRRGDPWTAWLRSEEALILIEGLRRAGDRLDLRASFSAGKQDYYDFTVEVLLELARQEPEPYFALAFDTGERARARALLDGLPVSRRPGWTLDQKLIDAERKLGRRLNEVEERRRRSLDAADRQAAERELRDLLSDYRRLRTEMRRGLGLPDLEPIGLRAVQERVLDDDTALLQFDLGTPTSRLWWVTQATVQVFTLESKADLQRAATEAHTLASTGRRLAGAPARRHLKTLGRRLLGPVSDRLDQVSRLLIAADGALHYVPFAALGDPRADIYRPLIQSHELVSTPSVSVLDRLRRRPSQNPPVAALAVLADPVFSRRDERLGELRRRPEHDGPRGSDTFLPRLRSSRLEAEHLAALAAELELTPPLVATDFEARKDLLVNGRLDGYGILHIASHGTLDDRFPELSSLVFSTVDAEGRPLDGRLRSHEIHRLSLSADLVFLSACRTALGRSVDGEGLVGLTHAFFQAGARRTIVSLWDVQDRSSAELSRRFYDNLLRRQMSPAAALREAQGSMWQEPAWQDIHAWAGFLLQGDWR